MMKHLGLSLMCAGILISGCATGEQAASDNAAQQPQKEATAWWKTEGQTNAATAAASGPVTPKPAWIKLAAVDAASAATGKKLYDDKGCASCHTIGKGAVVGPDLKGITARVEPEWLETWLKDPTPVLDSDPYAKEMLTKYLVKMPNLNLTAPEIKALTDYMRQQDALVATK